MGDPPTLSPNRPTIEEVVPARVPRRFPIGTLLGMMAVFAVLLSVLRTLGVPPRAMAVFAGWVLTIAVGQALLFKGERPRLASSVAGMAFVVVWCLVASIIDRPSHLPILQFAISRLLSSVCIVPVAALYGYLTGIGIAGVFLVCHRIRTGHWNETRRVEAPPHSFHRFLPILETERLRLRPFEQRDADQVQPLIRDAEVAATTTLLPQSYPGRWVQTWISIHELNARYGLEMVSAIVRREDGQVLGAIRLRFSNGQTRGELDGWIGRPYWNQGYATEAGQAMLAYAFEQLHLQEIFARPMLRNPAAARVLVKLGLQPGEILPQYWGKKEVPEDCQHYAISCSDKRPADASTLSP